MKLSNYDPEELTEEEICDKVAQSIYYKQGYGPLCEEFMGAIGYTHLASSNRIVFSNGEFVIKFAATEDAIVYNREEANATTRLQDTEINVIAPIVKTQNSGYRWVKMKKADTQTTTTHYHSVQSKLASLGEQADVTDDNIGTINQQAVLVDYPSLSDTNLAEALEAHCPELH